MKWTTGVTDINDQWYVLAYLEGVKEQLVHYGTELPEQTDHQHSWSLALFVQSVAHDVAWKRADKNLVHHFKEMVVTRGIVEEREVR